MRRHFNHPTRVIVAAAILVVAVTATTAWAHVQISSRSPKPGSTVSKSLRTVKITFNGPLRSGTLKVYGPKGGKVSIGNGGRDATNIKRLKTTLKSGLKVGKYTAKWTETAADGHKKNGSFTFSLKK